MGRTLRFSIRFGLALVVVSSLSFAWHVDRLKGALKGRRPEDAP